MIHVDVGVSAGCFLSFEKAVSLMDPAVDILYILTMIENPKQFVKVDHDFVGHESMKAEMLERMGEVAQRTFVAVCEQRNIFFVSCVEIGSVGQGISQVVQDEDIDVLVLPYEEEKSGLFARIVGSQSLIEYCTQHADCDLFIAKRGNTRKVHGIAKRHNYRESYIPKEEPLVPLARSVRVTESFRATAKSPNRKSASEADDRRERNHNNDLEPLQPMSNEQLGRKWSERGKRDKERESADAMEDKNRESYERSSKLHPPTSSAHTSSTSPSSIAQQSAVHVASPSKRLFPPSLSPRTSGSGTSQEAEAPLPSIYRSTSDAQRKSADSGIQIHTIDENSGDEAGIDY